MADKWGRVANAIRTNRFPRWPWATIARACEVAAAGGFETVEAERAVRTALDDEYAGALSVVGVSGALATRPTSANGSAAATPKWGQSAHPGTRGARGRLQPTEARGGSEIATC